MCQEIMLDFNKVFNANKYDTKKNKQAADIKALFEQQRADLLTLKDSGAFTESEYTDNYKKLTAQESSMLVAVKTTIPDKYFFNAAWKVLEKRGVWPFRKPFRSERHMIREMDKDEATGAVRMIGEKILGYQTTVEDDKKKASN
jgi:hypothetical protein